MNLIWKYDRHKHPYILHDEKKEDMPDEMKVIFQIWKYRDNRENKVGNLKEIFTNYYDSLKKEDGPFYFVYSEIIEKSNEEINLSDIPDFKGVFQ